MKDEKKTFDIFDYLKRNGVQEGDAIMLYSLTHGDIKCVIRAHNDKRCIFAPELGMVFDEYGRLDPNGVCLLFPCLGFGWEYAERIFLRNFTFVVGKFSQYDEETVGLVFQDENKHWNILTIDSDNGKVLVHRLYGTVNNEYYIMKLTEIERFAYKDEAENFSKEISKKVDIEELNKNGKVILKEDMKVDIIALLDRIGALYMNTMDVYGKGMTEAKIIDWSTNHIKVRYCQYDLMNFRWKEIMLDRYGCGLDSGEQIIFPSKKATRWAYDNGRINHDFFKHENYFLIEFDENDDNILFVVKNIGGHYVLVDVNGVIQNFAYDKEYEFADFDDKEEFIKNFNHERYEKNRGSFLRLENACKCSFPENVSAGISEDVLKKVVSEVNRTKCKK